MKLSKDHMRRWNKTLKDLLDERRRLEAQYQDAFEALERSELARQLNAYTCLLYTSPSPRDKRQSRMPSSA